MSRDLLNAPKTHALLTALRIDRVDVSPGTSLHTALMEFAHVEATKAADLVKEYQRANPITIEVKTSEEARRVIDAVQSVERATIKALADALEDHGARGNMGDPEWHSFHCIENGHDSACDADRAALRLAGR